MKVHSAGACVGFSHLHFNTNENVPGWCFRWLFPLAQNANENPPGWHLRWLLLLAQNVDENTPGWRLRWLFSFIPNANENAPPCVGFSQVQLFSYHHRPPHPGLPTQQHRLHHPMRQGCSAQTPGPSIP